MATDFLNAPHPLIRTPILYVADVPGRVKWNHLLEVFQPCGQVRSGGRSTVTNNRKKWTILFTNVFEAEMALATLQGRQVPGVNPPFVLHLSHSPQLVSASPPSPLFPQFIHSDFAEHPLYKADAQDIFTWFRAAGPLASIRVDVDVGRARPVCTVEYWDEVHANHARTNGRTLCKILEDMPWFSLRTYDPSNLYCAKLGITFKATDLREEFAKFGQIVEARLVRSGIPDAYGFVSYWRRDEAEAAMKEMNGKTIGASVIQVRYHEPKFQAVFRMPFKARPGPNGPKSNADDAAPNAGAGPNQANNAADEARRQEDAKKAEEVTAQQKLREAQEKLERERQERERQERERLERERLERERIQRERLERERLEREREATRLAERRAKREAAKRKREEAQQAEGRAIIEKTEAEEEDWAAKTSLADATRAHDDAKKHLLQSDEAVREAERALEIAKRQREEAAQVGINCLERKVEAATRQRGTTIRLQMAEQEEARRRAEREEAETNEKIVLEETEEVDEEARRQQELAESIRKMKELREIEEADRHEKLAKEQQAKREKEEAELRRQAAEKIAQAERERRERLEREEAERRRQAAERAAQAERERKEREEREKAEREQREREEAEARRQRLYQEASAKEKRRCWERDCTQWNIHKSGNVWTKQRGIDRFQAISVEFDELKFCDTQPLTFESIPWPLLGSPYRIKVDDIEWSAVEEFFAAAQLVVSDAQYKAMVEKAHRRFHPDKWRSRGILNTVLDVDLRKRLEEAGNIVAQALTPIWLASKRRPMI